jgi:hypothetical protein
MGAVFVIIGISVLLASDCFEYVNQEMDCGFSTALPTAGMARKK